jgi:hypothetical protein
VALRAAVITLQDRRAQRVGSSTLFCARSTASRRPREGALALRFLLGGRVRSAGRFESALAQAQLQWWPRRFSRERHRSDFVEPPPRRSLHQPDDALDQQRRLAGAGARLEHESSFPSLDSNAILRASWSTAARPSQALQSAKACTTRGSGGACAREAQLRIQSLGADTPS